MIGEGVRKLHAPPYIVLCNMVSVELDDSSDLTSFILKGERGDVLTYNLEGILCRKSLGDVPLILRLFHELDEFMHRGNDGGIFLTVLIRGGGEEIEGGQLFSLGGHVIDPLAEGTLTERSKSAFTVKATLESMANEEGVDLVDQIRGILEHLYHRSGH